MTTMNEVKIIPASGYYNCLPDIMDSTAWVMLPYSDAPDGWIRFTAYICPGCNNWQVEGDERTDPEDDMLDAAQAHREECEMLNWLAAMQDVPWHTDCEVYR